MEPWQGGGAPWCIGSVFPAPQLLTGAAAIPLGPLLFDGIGTPQRLLSTGSPLPLFESFTPSISEQKEEFLSFPGDVYVPEDILEEHLEEDTVVRKAIGVYRSQILGNRLQLVECRDGDVALFFPTGNNGDRIGSTVCSRDNTVKRWHDASSHQSVANSTSVPLRQPIFQLSAVRKDAWDPDCGFLVAARSLYNVQFLAANQEKSEVRFSRPTAASFAKYVSHVAWNQHVQGEAAVVVETGEVLLFELHRGWSTNKVNAKASYNLPLKQESNSSTMHPNSFRTRRINRPRAKMAMHKKKVKPPPVSSPFEWWQCEYAWHPKILLLASSREVSLMDFRASSHSKADHENLNNNASVVVARIPGVGRTAGYLNRAGGSEAISAFARGDDHEGSSVYEFCVSTKKHLLLFDTRQPLTPLLQWLHGMDAEPPSVLAMCPIPSSSQGSSDKGKVILAASFHSGNIQAFCYGPHPSPASPPQNGLSTPSTPSHLDERTHAWGLPSKVIAPQGTRNSWATILDSDMNFFQQREMSKVKRKWDRLAGFIVLPSQAQNIKHRGFSLMELSGDGDLLAQQFQAADRLRSVGPQASPLHSSLNSDPTGIKSRAKRCNVTKLEHFLNYIRNGSSGPTSTGSKKPDDDDDVTMESGLTSEEDHQYALVPYNKSLSPSINQPDHAFALQLHEEYNREKLTTLVAETLQLTNVPLSLYEISHVVLRRYLPPSLSRLAAGMPADIRSPQRRRYISILQTSQLPPEPPGTIVEYHNSQEEEDEASSLSSSTVPLPALLAPNSSTSSTTTVLEQGCDHVRRALVHSLLASSNSTGGESTTDLSLADSVEAWNNNAAESSTRLVQYQTSDRESVLPRFHGKPIRGQALEMTSEEHQVGGGDCFDGGGGVRSFYGVLAEGGGGQHQGKVLEDDHLCPIQLPFRESGDGVKTSGLSGLRDQFKQWQQSFVPYQNFCRNRLPNL